MVVAKRKIATKRSVYTAIKREPTIVDQRIEHLEKVISNQLPLVAGLAKQVKERLDELDRHSALRMQNYKALADKVEGLEAYVKQLRSEVHKTGADLTAVERRQDNIDKTQLDVKNKLAEAKFYDARKISDHVAQLEVRTKQLGVDVVRLQNGQLMIHEDSIGAISWARTGETAY